MQVSRQANCHRGAVSVLRVLLCPPFPTLWLCGIARIRSHPRPQAHYWQRAVAARSIVQRPRSSEECSANRPLGVAALRATADLPLVTSSLALATAASVHHSGLAVRPASCSQDVWMLLLTATCWAPVRYSISPWKFAGWPTESESLQVRKGIL
jgi:hypothetical protein